MKLSDKRAQDNIAYTTKLTLQVDSIYNADHTDYLLQGRFYYVKFIERQ